MKKTYIVYDSRAGDGDTDNASVLEAFDAESDEKAMEEARDCWATMAAVLYRYDNDPGTNNLMGEHLVGFVDDYKTFPKRKKMK